MKKMPFVRYVNLLVFLATLTANGLANALPLNNQTTGEISDRFDVYFVPAGYVFAIWGLIYLALGAFAIYQLLPAQRDNALIDRIGYVFAVGSLANTAWIFLWHYEYFPLTLAAMIVLLISLIVVYLRIRVGREQVSTADRWLVQIPFQIYLGWITVATIANVTSLLEFLGWGGWGISPEIWAVVMLVVGAVVAGLVSLTRNDIPYVLVIIWAFAGIAVKHAETSIVMLPAAGLAVLLAVVMVFSAVRNRQQRTLFS